VAVAHGAELLLVRVTELATWAMNMGDLPYGSYEEITRVLEDDTARYLAQVLERVSGASVRAKSVQLQGPVALRLVDWEIAEEPDLVVMSTHGRSGLARFALGSVADRLVREGTRPVLTVRGSVPPDAKLDRTLLLLDGSGPAEEALPLAETLAGKPLRSVTLFRAVADPQDRSPAETYLRGVAARLADKGLKTEVQTDLGEPRHVVENAASGHDLVILCTHGRSGFDRLRHGSVADYVIRHVDKPVLLIRARDVGPE
jgi:nucleotide-binding universal stress UspA family protein